MRRKNSLVHVDNNVTQDTTFLLDWPKQVFSYFFLVQEYVDST